MHHKRILVTGGIGFIGSHLVRKLANIDNEMLIFDNYFTGKEYFVSESKDKIKIFKGDLRNPQDVEKSVLDFKPGLVFHLAALHYIPYCNQNPIETIDVNVAGTENLLQTCKKYGRLEKFLFTSSAAVYPIFDNANVENSIIAATDIYGNTKYFGEHLVRTFYEETGISCYVARLFNVFGTNETNPHVIPAILDQLIDSTSIQLGNLEPKRDYIFVEDVADALIEITDKCSKSLDVFNVGSGKEYSVYELLETIENICQIKIEITKSTKRTRKSDRLHLLADISKIKNEIGWQPKFDLPNGLKTIIEKEYEDILTHR
ncbi:MAG: GDP-mannose 4,6-dehydratase [Candidatus Hodarchaeota archaeon]